MHFKVNLKDIKRNKVTYLFQRYYCSNSQKKFKLFNLLNKKEVLLDIIINNQDINLKSYSKEAFLIERKHLKYCQNLNNFIVTGQLIKKDQIYNIINHNSSKKDEYHIHLLDNRSNLEYKIFLKK